MADQHKLLMGSLELCNLPDLSITALHMRVDTGATTSSLHVDNIEAFTKNDVSWVSFDIHPDHHDVKKVARREAKVLDIRTIKSSSGEEQSRYVIETMLEINDQSWPIQISLSDRSSMTYLMLLGRQAMNGHVIVDPELEYILSE